MPLLPRRVQLCFNRAFEDIEKNPRSPTPNANVHALEGYSNVWTLRYLERGGGWRGIYAIDGQEVVFVVFGHRKSVYAQLHALLPPEGEYLSRTSVERRR
ncbi:MAG: type II toxin-antitoxin system RelE/ParE family toxin [Thermoplasmata archaeon]|nr:type II toxin-antitoxin system RelE/ParE family toxin [Thermoplasmata archaeon]